MKRAFVIVALAAGCTPPPSLLRSTDYSTVQRIVLAERSGSAQAAQALEEELKQELPSQHRFELVANETFADARLSINVERWWVDERDLSQSSLSPSLALVRRLETMEATFYLTSANGEVSETYLRTASGAPRRFDETVWNDDLVAANAVQIVSAFMADLGAGGQLTPFRPAPAQTDPPGETAAPL